MKAMNVTMQKILEITADKLAVNQNILTPSTSFSDDLGADSLDVYELITAIEKEFKLTIPDDVAEKCTTVGAVIKYIESKTNVQKSDMPQQSDVVITNNLKGDITNKNLLKISAN
jgi:acyl carrier protein